MQYYTGAGIWVVDKMLGKSLRFCDRPSKRQENQKIQRVILSKPPLHPYFPKDLLSSTEVTFRRTCTSGYWMLSFNKIVRTPLSPPKLRHTSSPLKSALTQNNITLVPEKKNNNNKYTNKWINLLIEHTISIREIWFWSQEIESFLSATLLTVLVKLILTFDAPRR